MSIKLKGSSDGSVSLDAPADTSPSGTDVTFVLPTADGTGNQVLSTDGSGNLSFADNVSSGRNLIINGSMMVAQRATSVTGVANSANEGYQSLDRFGIYWANAAGGVCTVSQSSDVPANEGFSNSFKVDVTTADTSLNSNHFVYMSTKLEAREIRNSGWNYTSPSDYLTLSFWAKSTKAGTYCTTLRSYDSSGAYYYVFEYTLVANTWTKVTHSVPGHASLVFDDDSNVGLDVRWNFAVGTDRDDHTGNAWIDDGNAAATSNQVNFFDSTSNDFYLTGVQLEVGEVATAFERRSYHDELARCRRYYFQSKQLGDTYQGCYYGYGISTDRIGAQVRLPIEMRTTPSFVLIRPIDGVVDGAHRYLGVSSGSTGDVSFSSVGFADRGRLGFPYITLNSGSIVQGAGYLFHIEAHAEL